MPYIPFTGALDKEDEEKRRGYIPFTGELDPVAPVEHRYPAAPPPEQPRAAPAREVPSAPSPDAYDVGDQPYQRPLITADPLSRPYTGPAAPVDTRQVTGLAPNWEERSPERQARELERMTAPRIAPGPGVDRRSFLDKSVDAAASGVFRAGSAVSGAAGGVTGAVAPALDVLEPVTSIGGNPVRRLSEGFYQQASDARKKADSLTAPARSSTEAAYYSGIQSLAQNLMTIPLALAGSPAAALGSMGLFTAGDAWNNAKAAGVPDMEAAVYAASQGAIEIATEMMPLGALLKGIKSGSPIATTLWNVAANELPQEQLATILQDANDWAVLNPEKSASDYLAERPGAAYQTFIATVIGVGGNVAVGTALQRAADHLTGTDRGPLRLFGDSTTPEQLARSKGFLTPQNAPGSPGAVPAPQTPPAAAAPSSGQPTQRVAYSEPEGTISRQAGLTPIQIDAHAPVTVGGKKPDFAGALKRAGETLQQEEPQAAAPGAEPAEVWFGRKGDGYRTEGDAKQALRGREMRFPELDWRVEQQPNGLFRLAGYGRGAASEQAGAPGAGVVAGAAGVVGPAGEPAAGGSTQVHRPPGSAGANLAAPGAAAVGGEAAARNARAQGELFKLSVATDTPEFQRFIEGSKIQDVVYHGTNADFSAFDPYAQALGQRSTDSGLQFFTSDPAEASRFARPLADATHGVNVMPAYISLKNPLTVSADEAPAAFWRRAGSTLRAQMEEGSHDGIIVRSPRAGGSLFITRNPTQIKSSIGNVGAFDTSNPDIRMSLAGEPNATRQVGQQESGRGEYQTRDGGRQAAGASDRNRAVGTAQSEWNRGAAHAQPATLNVGLNTNDGKGIKPAAVQNELRKLGIRIVQEAVHTSDTEPTLVAQLSRPLTPAEADRVSAALHQEAIAQAVGQTGALYGPQAAKWGDFNPEFFLTLDGRRLSDAESRGAGRSDTAADAAPRQGAEGTLAPVPSFQRSGGRHGTSLVAVHYSDTAGISELSADRFGTGIKGDERARLSEPGVDKRIKRRVSLYPAKNETEQPQPEQGLGPHVYRTRLSNIYNSSAVPQAERDFVQSLRKGKGPNALEAAILDAGYSGYYNPEQQQVVVLNDNVPVRYEGKAKPELRVERKPERAPQKNETRTEEGELVRRLDNKELRDVIKARPILAMLAPSAALRHGELRVDVAERAAANEALKEAGSDLQLSVAEDGSETRSGRFSGDTRWAAHARTALMREGVDELTAIALVDGAEQAPKLRTLAELATFFTRRNRRLVGDWTRPESTRRVARGLYLEALHALIDTGNAIGWYDRKTKAALSIIAEVHPEIKTDPEARFSFITILAVTSNGVRSRDNFAMAEGLYRNVWKRTHKFPTQVPMGGERRGVMESTFQFLNAKIDEIGWRRVRNYMTSKHTAAEVRDWSGSQGTFGELVSAEVPGAVFLGPKLGSYFNNLYGRFDTITMDRWFMRTINRLRGNMLALPSNFDQQLTTLRDQIASGVDTFGVDPQAITREIDRFLRLPDRKRGDVLEAQVKLKSVAQYARLRHRDYAKPKPVANGGKKTFRDRTPANNLSKSLDNAFTGTKDAPGNGGDRAWIRGVMTQVQGMLQTSGITINNADLQAVLWYYEKDLHDKLLSQKEAADETPEDTDPKEAEDYETAARYAVDRLRESGVLAGRAGRVRPGAGPTAAGQEAAGAAQEPSLSTAELAPTQDLTGIDQSGAQPDEDTRASVKIIESKLRTATGLDFVMDAVPSESSGASSALAPKQLAQRRVLNLLADKYLGKKLVWFKANRRLANGVFSDLMPGHIFADVESATPHLALLGHELLHSIRATHPHIYESLRDRVLAAANDTVRAHWNALNKRRANQKLNALQQDKLEEEFIGDVMGDSFTDPTFWDKVFEGQSPSWTRQAADAILKWINGVIKWISDNKPFGTNAHFDDFTPALTAAADALRTFMREKNAPTAPRTESMALSVPTDTPEFKRWFGDSKVVDENGKPLVVYHGTPKRFTAFNPDKIGSNYAQSTGGFFFTSSQASAKFYAMDAADEHGGRPRVVKAYLSLQNPLIVKAPKTTLPEIYFDDNNREIFHRAFEDDSVDGIIVHGVEAFDDGSPRSIYIAYYPEQIKSATGNRGAFDPNNPDINLSTAEPDQPFYSALSRELGKAPMKQGDSKAWDQWITAAVNKGLVKNDEVAWTGLRDWLKMQQGKVSREAVQQFLDQSGVRVEETVLGGPDSQEPTIVAVDEHTGEATYGTTEAAPKFASYTLPGGTNYREVLLRLPEDMSAYDIRQTSDGKWRAISPGGSAYFGDTREQAMSRAKSNTAATGAYKSPHWDQPNVLAHIRMNDRTDADGKRVLFIEEIQSDWAQEGRKQGFGGNEEPRPAPITSLPTYWSVKPRTVQVKAHRQLFEQESQRVIQELKAQGLAGTTEKATAWLGADRLQQYKEDSALVREFFNQTGGSVDKPLSGDPVQAFDRMVSVLRPAVPDAFDGFQLKVRKEFGVYNESNALIARGATEQAARNSALQILNEQAVRAWEMRQRPRVPQAPFVGKTEAWTALALKRIIKLATDEGYDRVAFVTGEQSAERYDLSKHISKIAYKERANGTFYVTASDLNGRNVMEEDATRERLPDIVGKEVAEKMLRGEGEPFAKNTVSEGMKRLSGLDLKVGGEGMRAFYDKIVPNVLKDVLRKVGGGQLDTVRVQNTDRELGRNVIAQQIPGTGLWALWDDNAGRWLNGAELPVSSPDDALAMSEGAARAAADAIQREGRKPDMQQPGFDITPAMREKAAGGLPMFSLADAGAQPKTAGWTPERIDFLIEDQGDYKGGSKAYAAWVSPMDFIRATTPDKASADEVVSEAGALREDDFKSNPLPPRLYVDEKTWEINGHEGRHRMAGLAAAGVTKAPAMIVLGTRATREPVGFKMLWGQRWDFGAGHNMFADNLIPISYQHRDALNKTFGSRDINLSVADQYGQQRSTLRRDFVGQNVQPPKFAASDLKPGSVKSDKALKALTDYVDKEAPIIQAARLAGDTQVAKDMVRAVEALPGRLEDHQRRTTQQFVEPLVDELGQSASKIGMSAEHMIDAYGVYRLARHAAERNATLRQNGSKKTNPSGMSDAEAAQWMTWFNEPEQRELVAAFGRLDPLLKAVQDETDRLKLASGLLTQADINARANWQHYVSLQGDPGTPSGKDSGGSWVDDRDRHAKGRDSLSANPIVNTIKVLDNAVTNSEMSLVKKAVLDFAQAHGQTVGARVKTLAAIPMHDANGRFIRAVPNVDRHDDNALVYRNGNVEKVALFDDRKFSDAVKGLNRMPERGVFMHASAWATSKIARLLTKWNLAFPFVNAMRDMQQQMTLIAGSSIVTDSGQRINSRDVIAGVLKRLPAAYNAAARESFDAARTGRLSPLAREYIENGGSTGLLKYINDEKRLLNVQRDVEVAARSPKGLAILTGRKVNDIVSAYSEMFEMANRVAVYSSLRAQGMPMKQAVQFTKNLLNFNKSGAKVDHGMAALYAFARPAITDLTRSMQMLVSPKGAATVAGLLGAAVGLQVMLAMASGDDDEGRKKKYFHHSEYERYSYILLPNDVRIPVGYGPPRWVWTLAGAIVQTAMDPDVDPSLLVTTPSQLFGSISPLPMSNIDLTKRPTQWLATMMPTPIAGPLEVAVNRTPLDNPIHSDTESKAPFYTRPWKGTPQIWINASRDIYQATGGRIDIAPEDAAYLFQQYTGWVGRQVQNLSRVADRKRAGEPLIAKDIPIVETFVSPPDRSVEREARDVMEAGRDFERRFQDAALHDRKLFDKLKADKEGMLQMRFAQALDSVYRKYGQASSGMREQALKDPDTVRSKRLQLDDRRRIVVGGILAQYHKQKDKLAQDSE